MKKNMRKCRIGHNQTIQMLGIGMKSRIWIKVVIGMVNLDDGIINIWIYYENYLIVELD